LQNKRTVSAKAKTQLAKPIYKKHKPLKLPPDFLILAQRIEPIKISSCNFKESRKLNYPLLEAVFFRQMPFDG